MSVALLREGGKYYRKCKRFQSFRDVSEMSIFGCHKKIDPHLTPAFRLTVVDFTNNFLVG